MGRRGQEADEELKRFSPRMSKGATPMHALMHRVCDAIRPLGDRDAWIGRAPTRDQLRGTAGTRS